MNKYLFLGIVAIFIIVVLSLHVEPALTILVIILCSVLTTAVFMPYRVIQNEIKLFISLLTDGILLTIALTCFFGWQDTEGVTSLIFIAFGLVAALSLIQRRLFKPMQSGQKKTTVFGSFSKWYVNPDDRDIRTAILRWKDDGIDDEFIYRGLGLFGQIPESRFAEFIKAAHRRQINAEFGTRYSLHQVGDCRFRQLKKNEVLSANYFLYLKYPRWSYNDYRDCMDILKYTRLLGRETSQGTSGYLLTVDKSVNWYLTETKRRWLLLLERVKPRPLIKRIFNK